MSRSRNEENSVVRAREDADIAACATVLESVYETDGYPVEGVADARGWLHPPGLLNAWVAESSGAVVGHVAVTSPQEHDDAVRIWRDTHPDASSDLAVLGRLFVAAAARGTALGERLVRTASDDAAQRGQRLVLDVMTKDEAAIRLYERLGWQRIGSATHHHGAGDTEPAYCYISPEPI